MTLDGASSKATEAAHRIDINTASIGKSLGATSVQVYPHCLAAEPCFQRLGKK